MVAQFKTTIHKDRIVFASISAVFLFFKKAPAQLTATPIYE